MAAQQMTTLAHLVWCVSTLDFGLAWSVHACFACDTHLLHCNMMSMCRLLLKAAAYAAFVGHHPKYENGALP